MPEKSRIEIEEDALFNADMLQKFGETFEPYSALICHTFDLESLELETIENSLMECKIVTDIPQISEVNLSFWNIDGRYQLSLSTKLKPNMIPYENGLMPVKRKALGIIASIGVNPHEEGDIYDLFLTKRFFDGKERCEILASGNIPNSCDSELLLLTLKLLNKKGVFYKIPDSGE